MRARKEKPATFWRGVLLGIGGAALGWLLLLAGQLGRPVASDQWVEQAYTHKLLLANAVEGPRALIVAGSGALFGLDSGLLADHLGRPVINLGVNAGVQSQFIRRYAREAIRPGDWVILPLEYPLYHDRHRVNMAFNSYWLSHPGIRSLDLTLPQVARLIWFTSLGRLAEGYWGLPANHQVEGLYGPQNLDANGDQINSEPDKQEVWMREAVEASPVQRYAGLATDDQANWDHWRELAAYIEGRGGCAVFIAPAMLDRPEYHAGDEYRYYSTLASQARANGLNYWGEPLDFMYEKSLFFDTNYHLNAEARAVHSARVAKLLVRAFSSCH